MSWYTGNLWWHSADGHLLSLFLQICKVQSRHGLPVLEQSKAPTCPPVVMSHLPLKSLPPGVRWVLFLKKNNSLWCYNISCFALLTNCRLWSQNMSKWRVLKSTALVDCRLPLPAQWQAPQREKWHQQWSCAGALRHARLLSSACSMLCRPAESVGGSCQWQWIPLYFPSWNDIESTI